LKKQKILVLCFLLILGWSCRTQIVFDESEIKEISIGDKTLYLDLVIGKGESKEATLKAPISIAVDADGNVYAVDENNRGVFHYSSSGDFIRRLELKTESWRTFRPTNIAVASEGTIFLMDVHLRNRWKKRIHFISPLGKIFSSRDIPGFFRNFVECDNALFFSTYDENRSKLMVKVSRSGSNSLAFGEMSEGTGVYRYFKNKISVCTDGNSNIYISNIYHPLVRIFTTKGELKGKFIYETGIKNKKDSGDVEMPLAPSRVEGNMGFAVFDPEDHPLCYDIAVKGKKNIYLLMAVDHTSPAKKALFQFDFSGKLLAKVILPFTSHRIFIDAEGSFYFIGAANGKYILKFKEKRGI